MISLVVKHQTNIGNMKNSQCPCFKPPFNQNDFKSTVIGIDKTDGRFADITCDECLICGELWIHYFYEIEAFKNSGRWYRGLITHKQLNNINPGNTIQFLDSLDWHFAGGSYFNNAGFKRNQLKNGII